MPAYTATGLVVNRRDLGESDKIVILYTQEFGKLSAVARGARRPGSRLCGATELFTNSRFLLATGKSLDIITQCEITDSFHALRLDIERLARATYLCELLDRLTADRDASQSLELHGLIVAALKLLAHAAEYPDAVVHAYELRLLEIIGYAPVLDKCAHCGCPLDGRLLGFSASLGGALCAVDRLRADDVTNLSSDGLALLRAFESDVAESLLALRPTPKTATEVARALRWYIRSLVDRDLKSGDFLDRIRESG